MRNAECEDRESKIEISSELGVKNQNINLSGILLDIAIMVGYAFFNFFRF